MLNYMNLVVMTNCFTIGYLPAQKAWILVSTNKNFLKSVNCLHKSLMKHIALCPKYGLKTDCFTIIKIECLP